MRGVWFWLWCVAGILTFFAFAALPSIGLFILPLAVVTVVLLAWRAPLWPDSIGFLSGFGLVVAFIGLLGATSVRDTGIPYIPFFTTGLLVTAAGIAAYALARSR